MGTISVLWVGVSCLLGGTGSLPPAPVPVSLPARETNADLPGASPRVEEVTPTPPPAEVKDPEPSRPGEMGEGAKEQPPSAEAAKTEAEESWHIFSRPPFAEAGSLSWVTSTGLGRFNLIDWESRPNWDRLWWLDHWPSTEELHLYFSPGFNIHWWAGPVAFGAEPPPDLPPRVYDLYLDFTWAQHWAEGFATEVNFRPGLYTDFRTTPPDAFRAPGSGVAVLRLVPNLDLVAGIENLQRNQVKILPVGGVLWQPTPRWELRLVFPEPKVAVELYAREHLWGYVVGEYGGGRWTYKDDVGQSERVEYSDFRILFGLESRESYFGKVPVLQDLSASFLEVGYVFERRLRFTAEPLNCDPKPGWLIRFGCIW